MKISNLLIVFLLTCVCGLQAFGQDRAAKSQPTPTAAASPQPRRERNYYTITLTDSTVGAYVPDASNFLTDPVATLRENGFTVPPAAERHWQSLTVALRRLSNPKLPTGPQTPLIHKALVQNEVKDEVIRLQMPKGWIPVVGDLHGDGTTSVGDFLSDPVGSLRAQGVNVPDADESAWRQLADALKGLRRDYANPRATLDRKDSADSFYGTGVYKSTDSGHTWQIVGICNTARSCEKLKDACESLQDHSFEATAADGSLGMCLTARLATSTFYLRNSNSPTKPTDDLSLAAPKKTSEAALYCHGTVMCRKVKNICAALGGTYRPVYDLSGSCQSAHAVTQPPSVSQKSAGGRSAELNQAGTGRVTGVVVDRNQSDKRIANAGQPDLIIKQFLFPPTDDKALRVQVMNQGNAPSPECRLVLTIRKINGAAAGRHTHVNIPALASGKTVWLVVDAKSILPINISLAATTFKLNADATTIVAELDETNNEVWHNQ